MKGKLLLLFFFPLFLFSLEEQPWFGEVYEFHFLSRVSYSYFSKVNQAINPLTYTFHNGTIHFGLDFPFSPDWCADIDANVAASSKNSFSFRSSALQLRYLLADDLIGDPYSSAIGLSVRGTTHYSLRDISCPSNGECDVEGNLSLGKEFSAKDLRMRFWAYCAVGHANRGSFWIRGKGGLEWNYEEKHKAGVTVEITQGYGKHNWIDIDDFRGYGTLRDKALDLFFKYGYRFGVWGTLKFEYIRRLKAKVAPEGVNTFMVSYTIPFSL